MSDVQAPPPAVPAPFVVPGTDVAATPPPARSPRLGRVAMIAGLGVFAVSIITSIIVGAVGGPYAEHTSHGIQFAFYLGDPNAVKSALGLVIGLQVPLGTLVGIWAIVQGIVAAATKRGRRFGVIAIVFAALAPGLSLVAFFVSLGIAAA
jgi:hypothetical protein